MIGEDSTGGVAADATPPAVTVWRIVGDVTAIAGPWVAALGELDEVAKDRKVDAGPMHYGYATLAAVLGASRPVLAKHGLALFQVPTVDDGEVGMTTVVMHESGTWIEFAPLHLPAGATAQSTGSAATYSRRYAAMSILGLATEDNDGQTAAVRGPVTLSAANVARFRTAAAEALLTAEEIDGVVLDATEGRTMNPAAVYITEVDALRDALARAAQPTPVSDEEDEAWVNTARGLPDA